MHSMNPAAAAQDQILADPSILGEVDPYNATHLPTGLTMVVEDGEPVLRVVCVRSDKIEPEIIDDFVVDPPACRRQPVIVPQPVMQITEPEEDLGPSRIIIPIRRIKRHNPRFVNKNPHRRERNRRHRPAGYRKHVEREEKRLPFEVNRRKRRQFAEQRRSR